MATDAAAVAALPDDGLAGVLGALPPRSLAVARSVCKAWRDIIDARALLLRHLLPHSVRGVFINYIDHGRPQLFARPASSSTFPRIDGLLSFMPNGQELDWWNVLDHCNGLLLCNINWRKDLCVCNPATRRWTMLPSGDTKKVPSGAYIAFDPTISPKYEVFLIPEVPGKPAPPPAPAAQVYRRVQQQALDAPFCLERLFSLPEAEGAGALSIDEDDQMGEGQETLSIDGEDQIDNTLSMDREDQTDNTLPIDEEDQTDKEQPQDDDPCQLMEWPPLQWTLKVFSSGTGLWEDRLFVREGPPAGIVDDMRLDPWKPTWRGPRQRYAVCQNIRLYVHCRGSFMARFSLSTGTYQVIKMPTDVKHLKPFLGASKNVVYFGIFDDRGYLRLWALSESCGHMEWLLKYEVDVGLYADHIASLPYNDGRKQDGSWVVKEAKDYVSDNDSNVEAQSEEASEWDSDEDDICIVEAGDEYHHMGWFDILGFHPYKEVVFLAATFGVASYHLTNPNKIQYLGNSRPRCYYRNYTNDIYESFIYTPCMIGDLLHGDDTGDTSFIDEH